MKSWVEISGERLAENFRAVQHVVGADVAVVAIIKADGYGHGAALCAPVLREAGAQWLGVTDVEEGVAVRRALGEPLGGETTRILVMCGMEPQDAAAVVEHGLTPVVWTTVHVAALEAAAAAAGKRVRVHVEVDTGMARQGTASAEELRAVMRRIAGSAWVRCEGLMTHLCCAEVAGAETTAVAMERFRLAGMEMGESIPELVHVANTSAVDETSTTAQMEALTREMGADRMVRAGLALYGYCLGMEGEAHLRPLLKPVMTWKARLIGVREIEAGVTVGYGASFVAERAMRLGLLPVGYADGFRREASSGMGNGWVMVNGRRAPVVGRVSMNLTVVDVTGIAGVEVGSEAVLLGEGVSADDHARWAGTIAYDIVCGVRGQRALS